MPHARQLWTPLKCNERPFWTARIMCVHTNSAACMQWDPIMLRLVLQVFDPEFRKQFPSVERYFTTLARQPKFAAVVGDACSCAARRPSVSGTYHAVVVTAHSLTH